VLPTDLSTLKERLAELTDVFEKKTLTDKALRVWFDALRDFPCEQVMSLLINWPKTHTKFPAPADVRKTANELSIDQRERKALRERAEVIEWERSPRGAEFLQKMRATLNKPSRTPVEHWRHVLATKAPGTIGYETAKLALAKLDPQQREAGQDDEERIA
jgi:hypothetical protein